MTSRTNLLFLSTAALLVGTIFAGGLTSRRISEPLASPLDQIDPQLDGWEKYKDENLSAPTLHALDPTSYLVRTYTKGHMNLNLFVAFYAQQRAGESMHSPKHCLPGSGWEIWQQDSALIPVNGQKIRVNKYSIEGGGARMLMFYWYQSKTRIFASEYLGKILLARDTVLTGRTAASIVRIMLPDVPGASEQGVSFASKLIPEMQHCFGSLQPLISN